MEKANSFWQINGKYQDVREFHFSSQDMSFVAFFKNDDLIFVIDDTCDIISPNELLIIEPLKDEENPKKPNVKWDSILKNNFGINPMEIRPKENTKYKKLDISYKSLDLYRSFVSFQTEETLGLIEQNREILSLENAYDRESENLLVYNKSTSTLEKAQITLDKLKKRILNISKKMKKQEELVAENPSKNDENLKAELIQKLYIATEKLKRTERRIKRATKRSEAAYKELSLKRQQINEIKRRIDEKNHQIQDVKDKLFEEGPKYMPLENTKSVSSENEITAPDVLKETEELTFQNNNAMSRNEEIKEQTFLNNGESTMAKDTENKKVQETQEFKPPYVDDTTEPETSEIRFAKKSNILLDDKYKKIWLYSLSILLSLIIVFGIFYFISSDDVPVNEDIYNTNYIEQTYKEPAPVEPAPVEKIKVEEEVAVPAPMPTPVEPVVEPKKEVAPAPVVKPVKKVAPAPVKKVAPVTKKVAPAPKKEVVKPVVAPAPVVETKQEVIEESKYVGPVPEEYDDEEYFEEETAASEDEDFVEEDEDIETEDAEEEESSALEDAREEFTSKVIDNDKYLTVIAKIKSNYFTDSTNEILPLLETLEDMNTYWNEFRNLTYQEYYETDNTLKADIDYEEYANDEYMLRLYSNAYFDMYEYLVNEFVMTYEFANGTASDLYPVMEREMQTLGKPNTKLEILVELYKAIQRQGGSDAVINAINIRNEEEAILAPEIEATLIPLSTTTEITVSSDIMSDNEVIGEDEESTIITEDFDNDLLVQNESAQNDEEFVSVSEDDLSDILEEDDEVASTDDVEEGDSDEEETVMIDMTPSEEGAEDVEEETKEETITSAVAQPTPVVVVEELEDTETADATTEDVVEQNDEQDEEDSSDIAEAEDTDTDSDEEYADTEEDSVSEDDEENSEYSETETEDNLIDEEDEDIEYSDSSEYYEEDDLTL